MGDAFAGVFSVVDDKAESVFVQAKIARNTFGLQEQMADHLMILRLGLGDAGDRFFGNHQHVHGGLRVDVVKGEDEVVFVDDFSGNFAGDDFLEESHHTIISVSLAFC